MKLLRTLMLAATLAVPAITIADASKPAADFNLPGLKQPTVKLSDYKGKTVLLDFWASWCGPCRKSFPWMNQMQEKYGKDGLEVIAINVDEKRADADKFLVENPGKFTIAFDSKGSTPTAYNAQNMPTSILIDAKGNISYVHVSFSEEKAAEFETRIKELLAKKS
jgi:cytochrome c biogenesis protein CcmG, thiol:disulfide interchange protein DsbE